MAPPLSVFRSLILVNPCSSLAILNIFARQYAVAVASWTARWAFFRLTLSALQTLFNLKKRLHLFRSHPLPLLTLPRPQRLRYRRLPQSLSQSQQHLPQLTLPQLLT